MNICLGFRTFLWDLSSGFCSRNRSGRLLATFAATPSQRDGFCSSTSEPFTRRPSPSRARSATTGMTWNFQQLHIVGLSLVPTKGQRLLLGTAIGETWRDRTGPGKAQERKIITFVLPGWAIPAFRSHSPFPALATLFFTKFSKNLSKNYKIGTFPK